MYYKDDFYKEFRTEKELCEYLEEIDSRAEWIRITSKKLKVAAAGEETCTEVPGISLEALEKDTLSHSRLVLILPERICYIGNSAIKSLKGRARIDGKALAEVDKKTLAEILNKCLKVARGRALIRFCEGKIGQSCLVMKKIMPSYPCRICTWLPRHISMGTMRRQRF